MLTKNVEKQEKGLKITSHIQDDDMQYDDEWKQTWFGAILDHFLERSVLTSVRPDNGVDYVFPWLRTETASNRYRSGAVETEYKFFDVKMKSPFAQH